MQISHTDLCMYRHTTFATSNTITRHIETARKANTHDHPFNLHQDFIDKIKTLNPLDSHIYMPTVALQIEMINNSPHSHTTHALLLTPTC